MGYSKEFKEKIEREKNNRIESLDSLDRKDYEQASLIIENYHKANGKPETWSKEQIEAMKYQYAVMYKSLAEASNQYILSNFWLGVANMDSYIEKCKIKP